MASSSIHIACAFGPVSGVSESSRSARSTRPLPGRRLLSPLVTNCSIDSRPMRCVIRQAVSRELLYVKGRSSKTTHQLPAFPTPLPAVIGSPLDLSCICSQYFEAGQPVSRETRCMSGRFEWFRTEEGDVSHSQIVYAARKIDSSSLEKHLSPLLRNCHSLHSIHSHHSHYSHHSLRSLHIIYPYAQIKSTTHISHNP